MRGRGSERGITSGRDTGVHGDCVVGYGAETEQLISPMSSCLLSML